MMQKHDLLQRFYSKTCSLHFVHCVNVGYHCSGPCSFNSIPCQRMCIKNIHLRRLCVKVTFHLGDGGCGEVLRKVNTNTKCLTVT